MEISKRKTDHFKIVRRCARPLEGPLQVAPEFSTLTHASLDHCKRFNALIQTVQHPLTLDQVPIAGPRGCER